MPFIPGTPESLLPRSDSKNPASTCRGITSNGRPCRRPLSRSPQASPGTPVRRDSGVGYCWQHIDQAQDQATSLRQGLQNAAINERTSTDSLVDRLGLLEIKKRKEKQRRETEKQSNAQNFSRPTKQRKPRGFFELLCCITEVDESRPSRPVKVSDPTARPPIIRDPSSHTGELLSYIPKTASPQTTSLLLAELAKPISDSDIEGYIYMFWLTPEDLPTAPTETAPTLLAPSSRSNSGGRRTSDVLNTFAATTPNKKTILLKIGRAGNVQRRMNQWTRQCGYNLSLIRYYPYHPSPSASSVHVAPKTPRKVPHAHKIERLIHIELAGMRVQYDEKCSACGRGHREWFEVEASRSAVKVVDEVLRRWIDWGEKAAVR
ncbi:meiotically up-regulated gene 113-domain-containing protein [Calycina marina]|uniref:Meiotically up-regulated gene 113-domain-containing protein n=1 Tax=Calycina marina TaxID=1763456 RepID=A0A9P7YW33_9HELO|nr:meiotically up-regulated gene 113-domain-containing protein [Calycina marina]